MCSNIITDATVLPCTHRICGQCFQGIISHAITHAGNGAANSAAKEPSELENQVARRPKLSDPESGYSTASNDSSNGKMQFYGGVNDVSEKGQRYELGTSPIRVPSREPSFACPVCKRTIFIGNSLASGRRSRKNSVPSRPGSLEIPSAIEVISDYQRMEPQGVDVQYCEMCEVGASILAIIKCEQCKVRYCEECFQRYHPPRGPLASHFLLRIRHRHTSGRPRSRRMSGSHPSTPTLHELPPGNIVDEYQIGDSKQQGIRLATCAFHVVETMTIYCDECGVSLCHRCIEDGRHNGHNVKPIGSVYEAYKSDLSRVMNGLSSKARLVTNLIVQLRGMQNEIQNNYNVMEAKTVAQCNSLIEAVEQKKRGMLQLLNTEKERKYKV